MQASVEHPEGSGILIREIANYTTIRGERVAFGSSWLVTIPAKINRGKGRARKQLDTLEAAKQWAEREHTALKRGISYLDLNETERAQAASAVQSLRESGLKLSLITLVEDAIAARKLMPDSVSLVEAARCHQDHKGNITPKTVLDAVQELLRTKEKDGVSEVHAKDLRLRLNQFINKFGFEQVSDLTAKRIDGWLRDDLAVEKRTKVNYRRVVLTFVRFCERQGWLARGVIDGKDISKPKLKGNGSINIFKPEDLRLLLEQSSQKLRPYFVLGGLCGLRTAESLRLDWSEIDFKRNIIVVAAHKSKTASRRIVPLSDSARRWLLPLREDSGRLLPYYHIAKEVNRCLAKINKDRKTPLEWQQNGLRHTYISARMAVVKDAPKVALECGNSPAVIFSNYRELMHDDQAEEWFSVRPRKGEKVIRLHKHALAC